MGGRYRPGEHKWVFPNGAEIEFGHMQYETDVQNYQGAAYHRVAYDELTQFSENQYVYLFSRMRKHVGFPIMCGIRAASNPGGLGHAWVKQRFVTPEAEKAIKSLHHDEPSPSGMIFYNGPKRAFLPARVADNPSLDLRDYIDRMLSYLTPVLRAQPGS